MGNFAHNINIFGHISVEELEKNIVNVLAERNFQLTDNSDEADYSVAFIEKDGITTVYEDNTDSDYLIKELSKRTSLSTLVIDLLDSDCLSAVLVKNGRKYNTYISEPEMLEMRRTPSNAGNASRWKSVISDTDALDHIFKNTDDAETKLFALAELLGMNSELVALDYKYLDEFDLGEVKYLHFVDKNVPPIPDQPKFRIIWHDHISRADNHLSHSYKPLYAGDEFCWEVALLNEGKSTDQGFSVYSYSNCLTDKNIEFTRLELENFETKEIKNYTFEFQQFTENLRGYRVTDFHYCFDHSRYENIFKGKLKKYYRFRIYGKILKPCHVSDLTVLIHPLENYENGYIWHDLLDKPKDFKEEEK